MPLAGEQLTIKEALALCHVCGFKPAQLDVAVAVMTAESDRYTEAWHDNVNADGQVTSRDEGLYQINNVFHPKAGDMMDPKANVTYAYQLSKQGSDWDPWMAYVNGAHEKFLGAVKEVREGTDWRSREKLWV